MPYLAHGEERPGEMTGHGTPLVRALAQHGVSGPVEAGSHLGSTLKPGRAVLTLGVFRRSRSVAYIRADASPSEVHTEAIAAPETTRVKPNCQRVATIHLAVTPKRVHCPVAAYARLDSGCTERIRFAVSRRPVGVVSRWGGIRIAAHCRSGARPCSQPECPAYRARLSSSPEGQCRSSRLRVAPHPHGWLLGGHRPALRHRQMSDERPASHPRRHPTEAWQDRRRSHRHQGRECRGIRARKRRDAVAAARGHDGRQQSRGLQ